MNEGINDATVGYFTCKPHDEYVPRGRLLADITAMPKQRTLDLMCYRNILYNRWGMHLWAQAQKGRGMNTLPKDSTKSRHYSEPMTGSCSPLRWQSNGQSDWRRSAPTVSALRAIVAGQTHTSRRSFWRAPRPNRQSNARNVGRVRSMGLTLVPGQDTNTLFLHFPADEGTRVIDMVLPSLAKGHSRVPGKEVTRAILSCCSDVVFSEDSWRNLLGHERAQVISAMTSGSSINNWTLDIFKGSEWETLPSKLPETDSN